MRSLENQEYGKCRVWNIYMECGNRELWKTRSVESVQCGK